MIFINQLLNENIQLIPKIHEAKEKLWEALDRKRSIFSELELMKALGGDLNKKIIEKEDLVNHFEAKNINSQDFWNYFFFFNSQNDYYISLVKYKDVIFC
jgi:hypothetical protein